MSAVSQEARFLLIVGQVAVQGDSSCFQPVLCFPLRELSSCVEEDKAGGQLGCCSGQSQLYLCPHALATTLSHDPDPIAGMKGNVPACTLKRVMGDHNHLLQTQLAYLCILAYEAHLHGSFATPHPTACALTAPGVARTHPHQRRHTCHSQIVIP